jgi:Domain of unknown function (DUF4136)
MGHRLLATLTVMLAVGMLAVSACSQQPPAPAPGRIASLPFSVVATGDSGADIRNASTFSWASGLQQTSNDQSPGNASIEALLQESIVANLQGKGYRFSAVPGEGDLIITYLIALDAPGAGREQAGMYTGQLQPSLNLTSPDPGKYEKGTLEIEVIERSTGLTAWRSALQGFANLELDDAERRQRLGLMVDRMLAGVPAK